MRYTTGKVKEVWYNDLGETKRVAINGRTIRKIDQDGRNLIITDENDNITREEYDEFGNLTKKVHPDGSFVENSYEHTHNRLIRRVDERQITTTFAYDEKGLMTRKIEAAGTANERITEYTYDANGNQLTMTQLGLNDAPNAVTTMTYDSAGNLATIEDAEGHLTRFTEYDATGNVLTKIDPRGKTWSYTYDDDGRIESVTDPYLKTTRFE